LVTTENGRSYLNQNVAAFFRAEKAVFPEKIRHAIFEF
jgi:hypothetical protein